MCGIAALFFAQPSGEAPRLIARMTDQVRHRGPDSEGFALGAGDPVQFSLYSGPDTPEPVRSRLASIGNGHSLIESATGDARVALGHRRLSIIDLSPMGHQPMRDSRGRMLIFNGEIYNYIEVRQELMNLGRTFATQSDTEVLMVAYEQWGRDCLQRFNGMFAFVLVDALAGRVFIARDRFGVKPLYFWRSPVGFVAIGSEIKQFTVLPGWAARLDGVNAYAYLGFGLSDHGTRTLFKDVTQLGPGQYIESDIIDFAQRSDFMSAARSWYGLRSVETSSDLYENAERLRAVLTEAVQLRLRSDVPVGFSLSGGLDSSSIVCLAAEWLRAHDGNPPQTFSACSPVERFDERQFIEPINAAAGASAAYVFPELSGLRSCMDTVIRHHDEPLQSSTVYAEWRVYELMRQRGIVVAINGHGADEALGGYHFYLFARLANLLKLGRLTEAWSEARALRSLYGYGAVLQLQYIADLTAPEPVRRLLRRIVGKPMDGPEWVDAGRLGISDAARTHPHPLTDSALSAVCQLELRHTSLPVQLHWADRNSMAHSVEARNPFLDYRVVELLLGLPEDHRVSRGITKVVLREALGTRLPAMVRNRVDKMGFVTAEEAWVREQQPDAFRLMAREAVEQSQGVLRSGTVDALDAIIDGRQPYVPTLFRVICFGKWMHQFGVLVR